MNEQDWTGYTEEQWLAIEQALGVPVSEMNRFWLDSVAGNYLKRSSGEIDDTFNAERRARLAKIQKLAASLQEEIEGDPWLINDLLFDWPTSTLDHAFLPADRSVLRELSAAVGSYAEHRAIERGAPGKRARRQFWSTAADLYVEVTGRRVATSKAGDQTPSGPFVRFIDAVSAPLMHPESFSAYAIEEFADRYRRRGMGAKSTMKAD